MQEVDAERRIQLLRGIKPEATITASAPDEQAAERGTTPHKRERKRRRIAGEDDTDRDIRFAREDQAAIPVKGEIRLKSTKSNDAPLVDRRGHIDLFPIDGPRLSAPKNAEVEAEKAKKQKEYEDQYTMRFSNAAGFKKSIAEKPWYQSLDQEKDKLSEPLSKDVWGNDDPRRKEREKSKVAADDPMAAMQKGVSQLREVEKERRLWREEKNREMMELDGMQRRKKHRPHRKHEVEEVEEFSLDAPVVDKDEGKSHRSKHRHRHRHRSRSRDQRHERLQRRHHGQRSHGRLEDVAPSHDLGRATTDTTSSYRNLSAQVVS